MEQEFDSLEQEYEKEFNDFVDSINIEYINHLLEAEKEFSRLLESSFKEYGILSGDGNTAVSKPRQIPAYNKESVRNINAIQSGRGTLFNVNHEIIQVQKVANAKYNKRAGRAQLNLWGSDFSITFDSTFLLLTLNKAEPKAIKACYDMLINTNYTPVIDQLTDICRQMNLNDWDYFCLANEFSGKVTGNSNSQKILAWFLLLESGYKVRIGFYESDLAVLFATAQAIFNMPWFNIKGERYYAHLFDHDKITTYDMDYFKGNKSINVFHDKPLLIADLPKSKTIEFPFEGNVYSIDLVYDQNYINYYSSYPDIQIDYYFSLPVSTLFKESVEAKIAPYLRDKSQYESLLFLLNLVQYGFEYKTDTEQFNEEKYLIPEETIHYKYSDCEDRAIFFSWLVSDLLNLDIIALDFKGHLCAAVEITEPGIKGNIKHNGKDYIVCDPTYRGAPPGVVLPQYQLYQAEIIDFTRNMGNYKYTAQIWDKANRQGLFQAENNSNMTITGEGAIYLTGCTLNMKDSTGSGASESFVAKLDSSAGIKWIKLFHGPGSDLGYTISSFNDKFLYLSGYFEKSITIDGQTVYTDQDGSFYIARLDLSGNAIWLRNIEFPHDSTSKGITVVIDQEGKLRYFRPNDHFPRERNYMMEVDERGDCYIYASLPQAESRNAAGRYFEGGDDFDIVTYLLKGNENMLNHNYPRSVSFLYTLIQYLNESKGAVIQGTSLMEATTKIYSHITGNFKDRYLEIGKISDISSLDGITTLRTIDQQPITISRIQAEHGSRMRLSYLNGNAKINVLYGIRIGNDKVWNRVNYILLDKVTGEIVYNYDNQYRKKMPVNAQLL